MILCIGAFPAAKASFGDSLEDRLNISSSVLADLPCLSPLGFLFMMAGISMAPTLVETYKENLRRGELKNKKMSAEVQRKKRELDIRDAITMRLSVFGSMVELEQLPYPVEESERVVRTMLKEDGALRYGKFSRENGSISKVVWIARHLKA